MSGEAGPLLLAGNGWIAFGVGAALAIPVACARAATTSGLAAGALLAAGFTYAGGLPLLAAFAFLVAGGTVASRAGAARKRAYGAAQHDGARRSARHAFANAGPAAIWIAIGALRQRVDGAPPQAEGAFLDAAAFGSLTAALSDTVAGEIGMLFRATPRMLLFGAPVPRGTNGGMTWQGTGCGLLTACFLAGACRGLSVLAGGPQVAGSIWAAVAVGGFAGSVIDSVLGATVERRAGFGNEATNFASSLCGGAVAGWIAAGAAA